MLASAERATAHWHTAQAGDREHAIALKLRGLGHHLTGDYAAAITAYRKSLKMRRSLGADTMDEAIILNDLAEAERLSHLHLEADEHYREALRVARGVDYAEGVAYITGNLAGLALNQQDWSSAESWARSALTLSEKVNRQELIALDCHRLTLALMQQGKAAEALPYARRVVDIYTHLRSPDIEAARATLRECEG